MKKIKVESIKQSKEVCMKCINKHRYWTDKKCEWNKLDVAMDDQYWVDGMCVCPMKDGHIFVKPIGNLMEDCPYILEHIMALQKEKQDEES